MTLDAIIENKMALILETFVSEARVYQIVPPNKSNADIQNQLESFLSAIVFSLRRGHSKDPEALSIAAYHGEHRARLGYDLRGVLTEFAILRSTIVEIARQNESVTIAEAERLAEVLHASMTEAAASFTAQATRVSAVPVARIALRPGSASR
jgi:hypothetical protein